MRVESAFWLWRAALVGSLIGSLVTIGCKKSDKSDSQAASAASAPANPAAPAGAGEGAPLSGFDECLVGKWKADKVVLKMDPVGAEGGSNAALDIASDGASTMDFSPMSEVHAKASAGFNFDFKYSGQATAKLKTPARGTIEAEGAKFDELRVTASAKLPGAGAVPLFKDTKVSELAGMATALAGAAPGVPKVPGAVPAPPGNPASGIDASPVFSNSRYTCQGDSLRLENAQGAATWTFTRVR
ncbi:MAG: hypothetical protein ACOY0T_39360 [Myxococcota bacterium]